MRVVYAGYRKWAFEILKGLLEQNDGRYSVVGILTTKDQEVSYKSLNLDTFIVNPKNIKSRRNSAILKKLNPEVFLFYGWSWMIPKEIYDNYPCLILHTSPLPKYRGGSPLQHQIINGETRSAISIIQATAGIDEGPIYAQAPFSLQGTMDEVFRSVVKAGLKSTKDVLKGLADNTLKPKPQNEKLATVFKRRRPEESEITTWDLNKKTAKELYNFVRALGDPYPNAFMRCKDGGKLYIKVAEVKK